MKLSEPINSGEFEENVEANKLHALVGFSLLLEEQIDESPQDKVGFLIAVKNAVGSFGITPNMFCEQFGVHSSSVHRWCRRQAAPPAIVRPVILIWLNEMIQKKIKETMKVAELVDEVSDKTRKKIHDLRQA